MSFLNNHVKPRNTCSNSVSAKRELSESHTEEEAIELGNSISGNDDTESSVLSPASSTVWDLSSVTRAPEMVNKKRQLQKTTSESQEIHKESLKTLKQFDRNKENQPIEDEDDVFWRAVARELRKIVDGFCFVVKKNVPKQVGGRPSKNLSESSDRSKSRKTENLRVEISSNERLFAPKMNLRKDGRLKSAEQCNAIITKQDTISKQSYALTHQTKL
ncbi:hypothetical protein ILUMI_13338 [Ignelater luminosus]|uniref:Uncharacterized protein n=1 Tax=Ignelater luminosus TaxID=2038154 RepID=A0A8K0CSK3_IGNLU|nr:hypothetical protein ILUMI_13338 [Ignelater luminosus]